MKKLGCILLLLVLFLSGCSFSGVQDSNKEQIIPADSSIDLTDDTGTDVVSVSDGAINTSDTALSISNAAITTSVAINSQNNEHIVGYTLTNGKGRGFASSLTDKDNVLITLYYQNKDGLLIPVTRSAAKQQGVAKAALAGLVNEAVISEQLDYYGLYPVLPRGTKIKGMSINSSGLCVVDFSKDIQNYRNKADEQRIVSSIVYTLTTFKNISAVSIRIEGKAVNKLKFGTDLSYSLDRSNTFINSNDTEITDGYIKCDLYYTTNEINNKCYLIPVSVKLENVQQDLLPQAIINTLSKKPESDKYFTSIPEGVKLNSYSVNGNTAILDFSTEITQYGGSEKEKNILDQIYYTLSQFDGIQKAKIIIAGKQQPLPEGTEAWIEKNLPYSINEILVK